MKSSLAEMLTEVHECTSYHVPLTDLRRLPVSASAPYIREAQSVPKALRYVLAVCAVCLRAYCEGCGKEIKETRAGCAWFGTALNCCEKVGLRGLLNILSDLDVEAEEAPGGIPSSAGALLQLINDHFINERVVCYTAVLVSVVRASKLFELIDDVIMDIQLVTLPVDPARWMVYLQTARLLWTFMCQSELRRYITQYPYCDIPIFQHQHGARAWIEEGCEVEWSTNPLFVNVNARFRALRKTMDKWEKLLGSSPEQDVYMAPTIRFFKLVLRASRSYRIQYGQGRRMVWAKSRKQNVGDL
ncbi:uncharacterized protein EV420DRAFT_614973 [Desarmillaria tabescens]|uniref:Uncharacterized protein n=1 Tax=Armillaria tabescens TaxID=1929756 RepID=A0AA39K451_ARMTA|nr:uncharacterized protein EV420DRAFT_614973 [Desarmillaria tabescens]KAK0454002.1 hypothetical protein EV420DRAFT_614973 [Desarmillaria tabescens]